MKIKQTRFIPNSASMGEKGGNCHTNVTQFYEGLAQKKKARST